jgi:hypothetical protein
MAEQRDTLDRQRADVDEATVEALGKLGEALETVEQARGHLYAFHQLSGRADRQVQEAVTLLSAAGHREEAHTLERDVVGADVIEGRWTFHIVEEYDDGYYAAFKRAEQACREALADGARHLHEATMRSRAKAGGDA